MMYHYKVDYDRMPKKKKLQNANKVFDKMAKRKCLIEWLKESA